MKKYNFLGTRFIFHRLFLPVGPVYCLRNYVVMQLLGDGLPFFDCLTENNCSVKVNVIKHSPILIIPNNYRNYYSTKAIHTAILVQFHLGYN